MDGAVEPLTSIVVDEGGGVESLGRVEFWVVGFFVFLDVGEERGEGFVQVVKCLLLGGE